ncbi:MAG: DUF5776 domain-containing protein [Lentilactobacillus buchneri]|jgi:hypothetical protein|nr:DUF5776 domain-containing protein [Lentilactobacillus buchneri]
MHSLIKSIFKTLIVSLVGIGVFSTSNKVMATDGGASTDNSVVTIATRDTVPGSTGNNFLYGRGMVTEHQSDPSYNGRLYATSENYVTGTPSFKIFESTDHGGTWHKISEVTDTQNRGGMRYQPYLYELPEKIGNLAAGTLICAGNAIPSDMSKTSIDLYKSTDHGRSWTYLSTVTQGGTATTTTSKNGPVWEPFLKVIDHKLVCFYSDERDKPDHSQLLAHQASSNGVDWGQEIYDVADTRAAARPGMATVAQMPNGKYIMTYEMMGSVDGSGKTYYKISDDGLNWSPATLGTFLTNGGSPYVTVLSDGTVVANSTNGNVLVNTNNGVGSWTSVNTPMGGAYSRSLTPLSNGQVLIVNGGGYSGPSANANHTLTSMVFDLPAQYHRATVTFSDQPSELAAGKSTKFKVAMSDSSAADFDVATDDPNVTVAKQTDGSYQLTANANYVGEKTVTVTATKKTDSSFNGSFKVTLKGTATTTPSTPSTGGSTTTPVSSSSSSSSTTGSSSSSSSIPKTTSNSGPTTTSSSTSTSASTSIKKVKAFKVYAKRGIRVYKDVNLKKVVKSYQKQPRTSAKTFTVTGKAYSKSGLLRYKTTSGFITANSKYVAKLYYQKAPNRVKVISKSGLYEYSSAKASSKNRIKHIRKNTVLKVKKVSDKLFELTNGNYVTANKKFVIAK